MSYIRAEEMAQSIKCLSYKLEALSSDPPAAMQRSGVAAHTCSQHSRGKQGGDPGGLLSSQLR